VNISHVLHQVYLDLQNLDHAEKALSMMEQVEMVNMPLNNFNVSLPFPFATD
jgi:hypothetical protein